MTTTNLIVKKLSTLNNLVVKGNSTLKKNLAVAGNLAVNGNTALKKNLAVNGSTALKKNLAVAGATSLHALHVLGNAVLNHNLTVKGLIKSTNVGSNYSNAIKLNAQAVTAAFTNVSGLTLRVKNGWTLSNGTTFVTPAAGTYQIAYNATVAAPSVAISADIVMRVLKNGSLISTSASSAHTIALVQSHQSLGQTFQVVLAKGDKLNLQVAASSLIAGLQLSTTTLNGTIAPSVGFTIERVA